MLLAIVVSAVGLRTADLASTSLGRDEIAILQTATPRLMTASTPVPPPRDWWLPGGAARIMTQWTYGELGLRLPSLLLSALTIAVVGGLSFECSGALAALVAALALSLSPLALQGGREIGPVAWAGLSSVVAAWAFWRAGARPSLLVCLVMVGALGCLALVSKAALALLAAFAVDASVRSRSDRRQRLAWIAAAAVVVVVVCIFLPPRLTPVVAPPPLSGLSFITLNGLLPAWGGGGLLALTGLGLMVAWRRPATRLLVWWLVAALLLTLTPICVGARFEPADAAALEAAMVLLVGAAVAQICVWLRLADGSDRVGLPATVLACGVCALLLGPGTARQLAEAPLPWPSVAAMLRNNLGPVDPIVVMLDRNSLVFYAPDLERRILPQLPPGRSLSYLQGVRSGWLIAPWGVRFYPGWPKLRAWVEQFHAVDLSSDPRLHVYYFNDRGRPDALRQIATFDLPSETLVRGDLLQELASDPQLSAALLWKIDQLALWPTPSNLRNPALLATVSLLANGGSADRAASLAYRIASAEPDWPEAQTMLAAFQN